MNSYLSVLKKTLFSLTDSEPKTSQPPTPTHALKENWIYIHSEENSTTDEVINLNDTFVSNHLNDLSDEEARLALEKAAELAEEIRRNREVWLKKRISGAQKNQKYLSGSTSNISRNKLKLKLKSPAQLSRKRTAGHPLTPVSDDEAPVKSHSQALENCSDEKATSEQNGNVSSTRFSPSPKTKAKRSKLQKKHLGRASSQRVRILNQPAAKGMC